MKPPYEWDLQDINNLIAASIEESLILDYKASPALLLKNSEKKREFCKDVSAFANTQGGTIVYGVEENDNKPFRVDDGLSNSDVTREQIEQIIHSSINPIIENIRIKPILLSNGNYIYVIDIPQSSRAPHMHEYRYYKRFNFTSHAMQHYEIMDTMRRNETPILKHDLIFNEYSGERNGSFQIFLLNESINPAINILSSLYLGKDMKLKWDPKTGQERIQSFTKTSKYSERLDYSIYSGTLPIWKGMDRLMFHIPFEVIGDMNGFEIKVETISPGINIIDKWRIYHKFHRFESYQIED